MLTNIVLGTFLLLVIAVLFKTLDVITAGKRYLRNDDDPFKPGSTAWFKYGQGSDSWKETYGERKP